MTSEDRNALVDQADDFAARVIRRAAHRTASPLKERLEEEWLADLAGRRGHWQRLCLAFGCLWATRIIAAERLAAASATAVVATRDNTVALASGPEVLSRRTVVLMMIVSIHALLLYGFVSELPKRVVPPNGPMTGYYIEPVKVERHAIDSRVPLTGIDQTKVENLTFDPIHINDVADPTAISVTPVEAGIPTTIDLPPPAVRHVGGPGARFPASDDFYPAASRRAAEQGTSTIRVCVDTSGRLTGEPQIAKSSGIDRLDEGALRLARAGSGYYRSTLEDGHPVADCYPFRVHFILNP